jgi:hypothetical protein
MREFCELMERQPFLVITGLAAGAIIIAAVVGSLLQL